MHSTIKPTSNSIRLNDCPICSTQYKGKRCPFCHYRLVNKKDEKRTNTMRPKHVHGTHQKNILTKDSLNVQSAQADVDHSSFINSTKCIESSIANVKTVELYDMLDEQQGNDIIPNNVLNDSDSGGSGDLGHNMLPDIFHQLSHEIQLFKNVYPDYYPNTVYPFPKDPFPKGESN